MKKRYKFISVVEFSLLLLCLFATNNFFKRVKCATVQCEVVDGKNKIVDLEDFVEIFEPLHNKRITVIDLNEVKEKIKKLKIIDEVKIFKRQKDVCIKIKPHKILGIAYYNFKSQENPESNEEENLCPKFILDDGEKVFLKVQSEIDFIPVIFEEEDQKIEDLLPILEFINNNAKIKSMINTISLKENNFYLTTILNDSQLNLGSFFNQKSVIYKICNMHKIVYLSNDFPCIEFNDETLFLHKRKI